MEIGGDTLLPRASLKGGIACAGSGTSPFLKNCLIATRRKEPRGSVREKDEHERT